MFKFDTEERYDETGKSNIHSFNFSENYFAGGFYCCCVSCRAVSYTHLDVYKRQGQRSVKGIFKYGTEPDFKMDRERKRAE